MAIITLCGASYVSYNNWLTGADVALWIDSLANVIFTGIPPSLPAAVSCGVAFAARRLKQSKICCISTPRINIAGRVNHFVFDKTGTLTEDGLSVLGFINSSNSKFME